MTSPRLYDFFLSLRDDKQVRTPGIDEYFLVLDLLRKGYPVRNFDEFIFVLENIWAKSVQDKKQLREFLEPRRLRLEELMKLIGSEIAAQNSAGKAADNSTTIEDTKPPPVPPVGEGGKTGDITTTPPVTAAGSDDESKEDMDIGNPVKFAVSQEMMQQAGFLQFDRVNRELQLSETPYLFGNDYFPVHNRHLRQAWRTLKDKKESGPTTEINVQSTIDSLAVKGYFSEFNFIRKTINQTRLFIFIDRSESMMAVEEFGRELCLTALSSELHEKTEPLYFYGVPSRNEEMNDYLVTSEDWTTSYRIRQLFDGINKKDIVIMIYSDAGALKREYDRGRIERTLQFISFLYQRTGYISWVNPAPRSGWADTNADVLSNSVPMFEAERQSIENSIAALKGKSFTSI